MSVVTKYKSAFALCGALWTTLAFTCKIALAEIKPQGNVLFDTLAKLLQNFDGFGVPAAACAALLFWFYRKAPDWMPEKPNWPIAVCSALFGFFMVLGASYHRLDDWAFLLRGKYQFCLSLFCMAGYFILFYPALSALFVYLEKAPSGADSGLARWLGKHTLAKSFVILIVCWSPYLLIFLPGSVCPDAYNQLIQSFGVKQMTTHHPPFSSWIMGFLMWVGRSLGSDGLGIFLNIAFQTAVLAFAFACIIHNMRSFRVPPLFAVVVLGFFALLPVWPAFAQVLVKDTIYTAIFVLFVLQLARCFYLEWSIRDMFQLGITGALTCLLRNNGIYIVVPTIILLCFIKKEKKNRARILCVLGAIVIVSLSFTKVLYPGLGIKKGLVREMLSIPMQQTARYVQHFGDEVTKEEKEVLSRTMNYDKLPELYNPCISDPVKRTFKAESREDLTAYFKVWFQMLLKHPGVYFQAAFNHFYGYFYPVEDNKSNGHYLYLITGMVADDNFFDIHYREGSGPARSAVRNFSYLTLKIPGIGLLVSPATYTWAALILLAWLIHKRRFAPIVLLTPAFLNILICCVSPLNGSVRYALPTMAVMPLLIVCCAFLPKEAKEEGARP